MGQGFLAKLRAHRAARMKAHVFIQRMCSSFVIPGASQRGEPGSSKFPGMPLHGQGSMLRIALE